MYVAYINRSRAYSVIFCLSINRVLANVFSVVSEQAASCEAMTQRVASTQVCKLQAKEPMSSELAI